MELQRALRLARGLMSTHGLVGWTVALDRAKTRSGACHFRTRRITLSSHLTRLHSDEEVTDTILHEIAHALVGPTHGHDAVWRAKATAIGASGERCISPQAPSMEGEWRGRCPGGHEVTRHRRPTRLVSCSRCSSVFDARFLFDWTFRGRPAPMHARYNAALAQVRASVPSSTPRWRPTLGDEVSLYRANGERVVGVTEFIGDQWVHVRLDHAGLVKVALDVVHPTRVEGHNPAVTRSSTVTITG